MELSRRNFFRNGFGTATLALLAAKTLVADVCKVTLPQGEGPYYPEGDLERDADLVTLHAQDPSAEGEIIYVSGVVQDGACKPVSGALVEIWQACATGRYNHSEDPNGFLKLDTNFQYWGRTRTKENGAYLFRTIVPGHYPTGGGSYRPPHIHFKVHAPGHMSLTTQMYFDPRSYEDPALAKLVAELNGLESVPASLKVLFKQQAGRKQGIFDVTLQRNP